MQLLPAGVFPKAGLVLIVVGLAFILRRGVPKAYGLGLLMLGAFLLDTAGQLFRGESSVAQLGFQPAGFLAGDGWWTPLTSVFTHAPPGGGGFFNVHLISNLFVLVTAGPALESRIGERTFMLVFGVAAAAALVAHLVLAYATDIVDPGQVAIGASGGIFGLLTAFAVRHPRERLPVILFFIFWMPAFVVLLLYLGMNLYLMLASAGGVAWWGHFAGFLVGLAFAYTLPPGTPQPGSARVAKTLPDPAKLEPFATTPQLKRILERIRQFTPEALTHDDPHYVDAWLAKFFEKATCAQGHGFERRGLRATCSGGETTIEFGRT